MAQREDLIIDGYIFGSYGDARKANKELHNSQYLEERVSIMGPKQILALYDKLINDKVFSTPVGWEYLKNLKIKMIKAGIPEAEIKPIPLFNTFSEDIDNRELSHLARMYVKPGKSELIKAKDRLRFSLILNVILVVLVIGMFAITLMSPSPNIINYKTSITNQYSEWQNELEKREEAIREKEAQLESSGS